MIQMSPPVYEFDVYEAKADGTVVSPPAGFSYIPAGFPDADARWVDIRQDRDMDAKIEALTTGLEHGEAVVRIGNDPPPAAGLTADELFIVGDTPTGLWVGHANELALWNGTAWDFAVPSVGETHLVEDVFETWSWTAAGTWVKVMGIHAPPVGEIIMWAGAGVPTNFLLCDGAAFDQTAFPLLAAVLGSPNTPDLTGQFIRAGTPNLTPQQWTTGQARAPFLTSSVSGHDHGGHTGTESQSHNHVASYHAGKVGWEGDSADHYFTNTSHGLESDEGRKLTDDERQSHTHAISGDGAHNHTITGGDPETAPDHVVLAFIIRGA